MPNPDSMKYLLDNQLAPLTFSWAFLEAPLDVVVASVKQWREGYGRRLAISSHKGEVARLLLHLAPLANTRNRELFIGTNSGWTAYFDNDRNGGDVFTPASYLPKAFGMRGVAVSAAPNTMKSNRKDARGIYGGVRMSVYATRDIKYHNCLRSIAALNDGGKWVFHADGEVQSWEEPGRYQAKRIADRFTPELLETYCRHFGLNIFEPAFYGPDAVLIASDEPVSMIQTLEERQREMGLID